jgi:hypothetical protein
MWQARASFLQLDGLCRKNRRCLILVVALEWICMRVVSLFGLAIIKETTACTSSYSTSTVHNVMGLDN